MVYKRFDKKDFRLFWSGKFMSNQELAKELQKPYNRKLEKRKLDSFFTDNIWDADLADIQLINKFNKRIRF